MIETLLNDLRAERDLTAVLRDLAENHRDLLAKWNGACLDAILLDVEFAVRHLIEKVPHKTNMWDDIAIMFRAATPGVGACDYENTKRHFRMVDMMYWAMSGYSSFLDHNRDHERYGVTDDCEEAVRVLSRAMNALTSALQMVRYAKKDARPEVMARLSREMCLNCLHHVGGVRDGVAHVRAMVEGGRYDGGFGDGGNPVRVGTAAKVLVEEMRARLIEVLVEASRVTSEDVTP